MSSWIQRPQQALLVAVLSLVLLSLVFAPLVAYAAPAGTPEEGGGARGGDDPDPDGITGDGGGTGGEGDPDDPIIDVPEAHDMISRVILFVTLYLP